MLKARMNNPAMLVPDAMKAMLALAGSVQKALPAKLLQLCHLRASQINGCGVCVDMATRHVNEGGETAQRLIAVSAWRDTPYFTDAERAALALTEALTRISDRADPVPDDVWAEAARHHDEATLAALVIEIAMTNMWNRLNVATRQIAGAQSW